MHDVPAAQDQEIISKPVLWNHRRSPPWQLGAEVNSLRDADGHAIRPGPAGAWEDRMRISDVLRIKGTHVVTVTPDTRVRRILAVLAEHRIGVVVVSRDGTSVDGIASERDIVRALADRGAAVLSEPVTAIYTAEVRTVTPQTPIEEVMRMMTEHRVRHVPVVADGGLRGIVSIGDVVKNRISELETERAALTDYITGTRY
jgi:CBS domain-containing protein